jgi:hypothetical protein
LLTVYIEPVGADQVLLVEYGVVRAEEVEVLKLENKNAESLLKIFPCKLTRGRELSYEFNLKKNTLVSTK